MGTLISWVNSMLQSDGREERLPQVLPAYIRWGVNQLSALRLMILGIQSRILANKISAVWEAEEREGDIHSWIRSMSLEEWQRTFDASPTELRSILELSRDQVSGIGVDLLTDGITEIEVISNIGDYDVTNAMLIPGDQSDLKPIEIMVAGKVVGQVFSRDQTDILGLINTGLISNLKFSASSGVGCLTLTLLDPEE
jgi:hypothetical protein